MLTYRKRKTKKIYMCVFVSAEKDRVASWVIIDLCSKAVSVRVDWLQSCSKYICNSIKCPSKQRWGVTERVMEKEWECQCWLADRHDGDVFIGLLAEPTGSLQGANWFHSGLNGWEERQPTEATALHTSHWTRTPYTQCWLTGNNYKGHNNHILFSGQLWLHCLWVWHRRPPPFWETEAIKLTTWHIIFIIVFCKRRSNQMLVGHKVMLLILTNNNCVRFFSSVQQSGYKQHLSSFS